MKKEYKLTDVKEFLLEHYSLEWRGKVLDYGGERDPQESDVKGARFEAALVMYRNGERVPKIVSATNAEFYVLGENNNHSSGCWQKFRQKAEQIAQEPKL